MRNSLNSGLLLIQTSPSNNDPVSAILFHYVEYLIDKIAARFILFKDIIRLIIANPRQEIFIEI